MASIPGSTVEDLEARLKVDVLAEARACGGRILVHREPASVRAAAPPSADQDTWAQHTDDTQQNASSAPVVQPYWRATRTAHGGCAVFSCMRVRTQAGSRAGARGDNARAVQTPRGALQRPFQLSHSHARDAPRSSLQDEGYRLKYFRGPMSRSRSSVREKANDLDRLLTVLELGAAQREGAAFAIMSHTGTGTAGYAMAVSCAFLLTARNAPFRRTSQQQLLIGSPETRHLMEGGDEARDIASLIRVLKFGPAAKDIADAALEACGPACRHMEEELRAFLVLAASFMLGRRAAAQEGRSDVQMGSGAFVSFFKSRAELGFLLSHIKR